MKQDTGAIDRPKSDKWTINVGLYGVLVDFNKHAAIVHSYYDKLRTVSMATQMCIGPAQFWGPIHALGPNFWEHLPLYCWTDRILTMLNSGNWDWRVCTTPTLDSHCKVGTKRLLARQDIKGTLPTLYARDKSRYADSKSILIDDDPRVVDSFVRHGGQGILFTYAWHGDSEGCAVEWLTKQITKIVEGT